MTNLAGTRFRLAAVTLLTVTSTAQSQFPETEFGSNPEGERGPIAVLVALMRLRAM